MEYELLAPAGNLQAAKIAIDSGADAIYLGLSSFSARANAENFDEEALIQTIEYAKIFDVKIYVAMNTLVKEKERDEFVRTLLRVWNLGVDAVILQDLLLGKAIHTLFPEVVLHASTQAGICNEFGARFAQSCGFSRVILARETPLCEIEKITKIVETEVFVQGALCTCFSGQCYFSSFVGGNSGNRGRCKQPCRKLYSYDRKDYDEKSYALSLSDLCVGKEIEKFKTAGVTSFKIEGRMRRPEYVAAAVQYYRAILDGDEVNVDSAFQRLKRAYNRGNYTKGLAFSQDKRFLSRAVQGHLGEKVGVIKVENGIYAVESGYASDSGDSFKILRDGKEIGGATFLKKMKRGFILSSKQRLRTGDGVFLTTCVRSNQELLEVKRRKSLAIFLEFSVGEKATAVCRDVKTYSDWTAQKADSRPLTEDEIRSCFSKTDGLPFDVRIEEVKMNGDIFLPKSWLNSFRRSFFEEVAAIGISRRNLAYRDFETERKNERAEDKIAVIATDFSRLKNVEVAIYKLDDYRKEPHESFLAGDFEKYLYLPPYTATEDLSRFEELIKKYALNGVYAESYGGVAFALERGFYAFAGTGINLTNSISVLELKKLPCVKYYATSKELTDVETQGISDRGAFSLRCGDLKLMDLRYCPFEKKCKTCDRRKLYALTDENGRQFPVRRYVLSNGECNFEVYNCAKLIGTKIIGGTLVDCSMNSPEEVGGILQALISEELQKQIFEKYTYGHSKKSTL